MTSRPRGTLPTLKSLQAFEAAVRHNSFTLAAAEMNVTPSAVSHQIQVLEERLNLKLFERHAGGITPTKQARIFGSKLSSALDAIAQATDEIAPRKPASELLLMCGHSFAARWLQPNLSDFKKSHPEAQIRLQTFSRLADVAEKAFDIAICYGRPQVESLRIQPLLTEHIVPLCSPKLAAEVPVKELRDLRRITLIHSDNALGWSDYLQTFGLDLDDTQSGLWLDRSILALQAAAEGQGVVLESLFLARQELEARSLVAPFDSTEFGLENTSYYLVLGGQFKRNPLARQFRDWLIQSISDLEGVMKAGDIAPHDD